MPFCNTHRESSYEKQLKNSIVNWIRGVEYTTFVFSYKIPYIILGLMLPHGDKTGRNMLMDKVLQNQVSKKKKVTEAGVNYKRTQNIKIRAC